MRVMRVVSCQSLPAAASCCELLRFTFLREFLPLLLLLLYCYLLITASFGSPEPSSIATGGSSTFSQKIFPFDGNYMFFKILELRFYPH